MGGYPDDWDSRRRRVYRRDDYTCQNCGRDGGNGGEAEVHAHHVVPVSKGGSHRTSNLITLCRDCHGRIHPHLDDPEERSPVDASEAGLWYPGTPRSLSEPGTATANARRRSEDPYGSSGRGPSEPEDRGTVRPPSDSGGDPDGRLASTGPTGIDHPSGEATPTDTSSGSTGSERPSTGTAGDGGATTERSFQQEVLRGDGYECLHCGTRGGDGEGATELRARRIKPVPEGQPRDVSNWTTLCRDCYTRLGPGTSRTEDGFDTGSEDGDSSEGSDGTEASPAEVSERAGSADGSTSTAGAVSEAPDSFSGWAAPAEDRTLSGIAISEIGRDPKASGRRRKSEPQRRHCEPSETGTSDATPSRRPAPDGLSVRTKVSYMAVWFAIVLIDSIVLVVFSGPWQRPVSLPVVLGLVGMGVFGGLLLIAPVYWWKQ